MKDEEFTKALVSGDKEDGTDVHTLNMKKLGPVCRDRHNSKTFIYAWLLGAQAGKVSEILNCTKPKAKEAADNFIKGYPGLKQLKERDIPLDAKRGYTIGLDGRYLAVDEERKVLAAYLQNGEAIIMKLALVLWYKRLKEEGIPFMLVNWVHDEWVTETKPEHAEYIGKVQCWSIEEAGKLLNMNCPLSGSTDVGKTWADIH
jgi:DNA polymerase I-like protein with 3'-5' exonuclease and polymerase domains